MEKSSKSKNIHPCICLYWIINTRIGTKFLRKLFFFEFYWENPWRILRMAGKKNTGQNFSQNVLPSNFFPFWFSPPLVARKGCKNPVFEFGYDCFAFGEMPPLPPPVQLVPAPRVPGPARRRGGRGGVPPEARGPPCGRVVPVPGSHPVCPRVNGYK